MKTQSTNRNDSRHCTSAIMGSMSYSIETSNGETIIYAIDTLRDQKMQSCTQFLLNGTVSRDFFASGFFHESSFPKPMKIAIGSFRIFSKIRGDIRE